MSFDSRTGLSAGAPEVLIVDDDADVLFSLAVRFRKAGFRPILAASPEEALSRMAEHPACRRLLTDFCMPGQSGEAWIDQIRRQCVGWSVVVMSAADADPGPFVLAPKPLDITNLVQHFDRVCPPDDAAPARHRAAS